MMQLDRTSKWETTGDKDLRRAEWVCKPVRAMHHPPPSCRALFARALGTSKVDHSEAHRTRPNKFKLSMWLVPSEFSNYNESKLEKK